MKNLLLVILLFAGISSFCQNAGINVLSEQEKKEGWKLLFNGKNLDGWRKFQGDKVTGWKVSDGVLCKLGVGSDHDGDMVTKKKYKDFELYLEWKIVPGGNSGIFFRVDEKNVKHIIASGPEYQLLDDNGWPTKLEANQYTGGNYAMHAPENAEFKIDEWNTTRIIVKGTHVKHYLNGRLVVEYDLWSDDWEKRKNAGKWKSYPNYGMAKTGHIGLQDHVGLVQFRNIKIRKL